MEQNRIELVKHAMLAVQRYPWEQGVCAQALYELGDIPAAVAMAHDAVMRQSPDGRLAVPAANNTVTDPAANGEAVWRAWEITGDSYYKEGAEKMLDYLLRRAPRTANGTICHIDSCGDSACSADQIWVDSIYMAPPFLAVMGELEEAVRQIEGYVGYLQQNSHECGGNCQEKTAGKLLSHIYDAGRETFIRPQLWATGNGWALMGIGRVTEEAVRAGRLDLAVKLQELAVGILDAMLAYQLPDGRFHDILDDDTSFVDGASAMMMAAFVYRGIAQGWLPSGEDGLNRYLTAADRVAEAMESFVDAYGLVHGVCGAPDFAHEGTSAESMAAYLMMWAWKEKLVSMEKKRDER